MANHLSMANLQAIAALHRSGHSNRHIARVLGVNRETVGKYVSELQNQPNAQTGPDLHSVTASPQVKAGPLSSCEPFRDHIILGIEAGLSIKRIHQDLVREHGYTGTYHTCASYRRSLLTINSHWVIKLPQNFCDSFYTLLDHDVHHARYSPLISKVISADALLNIWIVYAHR